jgi:hypothetical protein
LTEQKSKELTRSFRLRRFRSHISELSKLEHSCLDRIDGYPISLMSVATILPRQNRYPVPNLRGAAGHGKRDEVGDLSRCIYSRCIAFVFTKSAIAAPTPSLISIVLG